MDEGKFGATLAAHVPAAALEYCINCRRIFSFDFRLRKSRVTKVGDFTFQPGRAPRITVNSDLHPFLFLITYLHEVAHVDVHRNHGPRAEAHGSAWKSSFRRLMEPVLNDTVFPTDILKSLQRHLEDPRATTFSDPHLMQVLRHYDPAARSVTYLSEIPQGSIFGLRGRWFRKGETKRTRALCQELRTKKKYFVPLDSQVENVQLSLL